MASTDKPYRITNICASAPLILDLDCLNYDPYMELFSTHCVGYGVSDHLTSYVKTPTEMIDVEWSCIYNIVKSWIYVTPSQYLLNMILKDNAYSHEVWSNSKTLFYDNKDMKAFQVDSELRTITIRDSSMTSYYTRIKTLANLLDNLDAKVLEKNIVMYTFNDLSSNFVYIATFIWHKTLIHTFSKTLLMLLVEEQQKKLSHPGPTFSCCLLLLSDSHFHGLSGQLRLKLG